MSIRKLLFILIVTVTLVSIGGWRYSRYRLRCSLRETVSNSEIGIETRVSAARRLWQLEQNTELVLPSLLAGLTAEDYRIREMAAEAIGDMGQPGRAAIPALVRAAKNPPAIEYSAQTQDGWYHFIGSASRALYKLGAHQVLDRPVLIESLTECLEDDNSLNDAQFLVLLALIDTDPRVAIPLHFAAFDSGSPGAIRWAHEYLMRFGPDDASALNLLAEGLGHESVSIRRWCAAAIVKLRASALPVAPRLARARSDKDPEVALLATLALGQMGQRIEMLQKATNKEVMEIATKWAEEQDFVLNASEFASPQETDYQDSRPEDIREQIMVQWREGDFEQAAALLSKYVSIFADRRAPSHSRLQVASYLRTAWIGFGNNQQVNWLQMVRRQHFDRLRQITLIAIKNLGDHNAKIRDEAARLLQALGPDAQLAAPALVVSARYDSRISSLAERALESVAPDVATGTLLLINP